MGRATPLGLISNSTGLSASQGGSVWEIAVLYTQTHIHINRGWETHRKAAVG